jgi:beta-glucuronidase
MRHLLLCLAALLGSCALPALAQEPTGTPLANVLARERVDLSGRWRFFPDPLERGILRLNGSRWDFPRDLKQEPGGTLKEYDFDTSPTLAVPGDWNSQSPEYRWYQGLMWYRRTVEWAPRPGRVFLYFEAANYRTWVFLNGEALGTHEGGFTPFAFEVTGKLRATNSLVVAVNNLHGAETIPGRDFDWWNYGGITRPVHLVVVPDTYVHDYAIGLAGHGPEDVVSGWVQVEGPARAGAQVEVAIAALSARVTATADAQGRAAFTLRPRGLERWSPESPRLYDVEVRAAGDRVRDEVGFRTVAAHGAEICLNGRPIYLRGISLHEEALGVEASRTLSWAQAEALLRLAKDLGANFVRLAHYPHTERMTRLADRLGLLVWSEVPIYQNVIAFDSPATLALATRMVTANIARDRNRASIVIWSVANETPVTDARTAFLTTLIARVRALDGTRLVSAAMDQNRVEGDRTIIDDPLGAAIDVLGINTYHGWYGDGLPDVIARKTFETAYEKPIVLSEFGADAPLGLRGDRLTRWTEDYQRYLFEENIARAARTPNVRGMSPWVLKDFRSPRRWHGAHQDFWNRKGLVSPTGERKLAFETLRAAYAGLATAWAAKPITCWPAPATPPRRPAAPAAR